MEDRKTHLDRVLAESKRLREEILRTAEELKSFADDLLTAARVLKEETPPAPGRTDDAGA